MGNPEAKDLLGAAVETTAPDLLAYFLRRTGSAADSADLLGETLLITWRRADAIPHDSLDARMWMFGIARNVVTTYTRTSRRRSAIQDKLRTHLRSVEAEVADDDPLDVGALVGQLPEIDQEIIRLTYWDGFTQKQAAQLMGMPEGTLRSRHHRARASLRKMLADVDYSSQY